MRKISIYLLKLFFARDKDFVPLTEVPLKVSQALLKTQGLGNECEARKVALFFSFQSFRGLPLLQTTKTSLTQE